MTGRNDCGSSCQDWTMKGTALSGTRTVIAGRSKRSCRSDLAKLGVLLRGFPAGNMRRGLESIRTTWPT